MICWITIEYKGVRHTIGHQFGYEELDTVRLGPVDACLSVLEPKLREIVEKACAGDQNEPSE